MKVPFVSVMIGACLVSTLALPTLPVVKTSIGFAAYHGGGAETEAANPGPTPIVVAGRGTRG